MAKKLVVKKGYTVEVVSWENDGDHYSTMSKTYDTAEKALCVKKLCNELFSCYHSGAEIGIGNICDDYEMARDRTLVYLKKNLNVLKLFATRADIELKDEETLVQIVMNINFDLLGGSDVYNSRICERCEVSYSAEDIHVEVINK
jgi:hypothetical protein